MRRPALFRVVIRNRSKSSLILHAAGGEVRYDEAHSVLDLVTVNLRRQVTNLEGFIVKPEQFVSYWSRSTCATLLGPVNKW